MIDHILLRVRSLEKSQAFYAAALKPLGYQVLVELPGGCGLGIDPKPDFWLADDGGKPHSRMHIAFAARSPEEVSAFYNAAIAAGAKDNGAPGLRLQYHPGYYGGFVIDPDGHNIEAVFHGAA
jgi:catechol 2,3-dioxygenase-like lactoylglutathione lyase family enzyme